MSNEMPTARRLLALLADGAVHSGTALGEQLGMSRAAIWKQLQGLQAAGIVVESTAGSGYRLQHAIRLLDADAILGAMGARAVRVEQLSVFWEIDSTNSWLLQQASAQHPGGVRVCLAEQQTAGRGRRGRQWASPLARNIYCSVRRRFEGGLESLSGLSLVVGIALAEALASVGVPDVRLKWPNDLRARDAKLGGILVELMAESCGPCDAVLGFGLNVDLPPGLQERVGQPVVDLRSLTESIPDRNVITAQALSALVGALDQFEAEGFAPFTARWRRLDAFWHKPVQIQGAGAESLSGRALGVDERGALLLETATGLRRIVAGEVSLRAGG